MGPLMAASVVMLVPIILVFFLAQKAFVEGISLTGLTGR
jgi:multiple sugar transport system permease protein